jgi:general secretion pathway protein B
MSYILDALRKAEAQRGQGALPGLHTPPPAGAAVAPSARLESGGRTLLALGALVLLALAGVMAWRALERGSTAGAPVETAAPAGASTAVLEAAPIAAPPPATPAPAAAVRLTAPTPPAPGVAALPPPTSPLPAPPGPPRAAQATASPTAASPTAAPTAAPSDAPAAAAPAPVRLYKLAELPAEIRQQLPTLSVGGAMHSENAGSRLLILSGQVYREGEQPAPGLTLERIQLRSAVLAFKGYRFEIAY